MSSQPLYPAYLPTRPDGYAPPIEVPPFDATEPGAQADPAKPSLFKAGSVITDITPRIGSEITGVQISQLSKKGLDEVALLAAERGVVVFVRPLDLASRLPNNTYFSVTRTLPTPDSISNAK